MTGASRAIGVAERRDLPDIELLLEAAGLTREGLLACERAGLLLAVRVEDGCVALELYDGVVLLPRWRSRLAPAGTGWAARS